MPIMCVAVNRQMTAEADECVGQSRRRVKLYTLNEERVWADQGTGHVTYSYDEFKATSLVVRSELNGMLTGHLVLHLPTVCFPSELVCDNCAQPTTD